MKAIKIFLTVIFIMAMTFGVKAQDKYEYATVVCQIFSKKVLIGISMKGKYEEHEIASNNGALSLNLTPAIDEISKMTEQGWEVYANNVAGENSPRFIYFLRKKK